MHIKREELDKYDQGLVDRIKLNSIARHNEANTYQDAMDRHNNDPVLTDFLRLFLQERRSGPVRRRLSTRGNVLQQGRSRNRHVTIQVPPRKLCEKVPAVLLEGLHQDNPASEPTDRPTKKAKATHQSLLVPTHHGGFPFPPATRKRVAAFDSTPVNEIFNNVEEERRMDTEDHAREDEHSGQHRLGSDYLPVTRMDGDTTSWLESNTMVTDLGVTYRVFDRKRHQGATAIMDEFFGIKSLKNFEKIPVKEGDMDLHAKAHSCLSHSRGKVERKRYGEIPRIKATHTVRKKSLGKQNLLIIDTIEPKGGKTVHRSHLSYIPEATFSMAGQCQVRDEIAKTMGGVRVPFVVQGTNKSRSVFLWHFESPVTSSDFLLLSILITCGHLKTYMTMYQSLILTSLAGTHEEVVVSGIGQTRKVTAAGYKRKDSETVLFYLLAAPNNGKTRMDAKGCPYFAIAVPKNKTNKRPLIVRLL